MANTAPAEQLGKKFELRHYEALRREALAPAIGKTGIDGAQTAELEALMHRRRVEVISLLAEAMKPESLRSVIDTHYEIEAVDGKLVADDKEPIEDMLRRAHEEALELANHDPFFAEFLPARNQAELDELADQEAMVRGERPYNTILKFSPYSEEYDDGTDEIRVKLIEAGQKPYWRRAMVRVSHAHEGKLHSFNISIDNSRVELLKETAWRHLGYEFQAKNSTEMLAESIHLDIADESWRGLTKNIAQTADNILQERHGGEYKQGNPEHKVRQAQSYVESQTQVVDSLLAADARLAVTHANYESYEAAFAHETYNAIALLEKRLELGRQDEKITDYAAASSGAGDLARAGGKSYDACGLVIGSGEAEQASTGQKTGFESLLRLENKKVKCPECNSKVVVPKTDLERGHLYCKDCGYDLDVCTGKKTFRRGERSPRTKTIGAFEVFVNSLRREGIVWRLRRLAKRQEVSENQWDKRRLQNDIQREAAELEILQRAA